MPQPTIKPTPLSIAIRVYPYPEKKKQNGETRIEEHFAIPDEMLVFDTETRIDPSQRLSFGSYRYVSAGKCLEEGIFYGDDISEAELQMLQTYIDKYQGTTFRNGKTIRLLTRTEFLEKFYRWSYKDRILVVGFNLPFDISRIAEDVTVAKGNFVGGFSFGMGSYTDKSGQMLPDKYRPRFRIKHIDSKRALKGWTGRKNPDEEDLIPEGSQTGEPKDGYKFRGHILDLRTHAFALTDRGYSLESACKDFDVEHKKKPTIHHGTITPEYIDYNRDDVLSSKELAEKLLEEYKKHPIALQPTQAFSPASLGKSYLAAMGIPPILKRQPDFPSEYLGYAQTAFIGGRTSAHIRNHSVPVVYTDFLSMYPTVNQLLGLWDFVIANRIEVEEHCHQDISAWLHTLNPEELFHPATWKLLNGFVKVIPNGDILPTRGLYSEESNDWQVGLNYLYASNAKLNTALWYTLPDLVSSVVQTGRVPKIVDAFRIIPNGKFPGLCKVKLRGDIEVDPATQDFFKVVIEQRKRLSGRTDLTETEKGLLDRALKVLANATSYGIYAEMIRKETDEPVEVKCCGLDKEPYRCRVSHPDDPGKYCFPPMASLITGAARLMLTLLEHSVTELGGTYAMEDTDSMAIVATKEGGLVPCPGGPHLMSKRREAVKALSWEQVRGIRETFTQLSPYDQNAIPGSILKLEDDNFEVDEKFNPRKVAQRQLYCFAVSAKRYCLHLRDENGVPILLREKVNNKKDRWSQHGLGHLLNPIDPESEDRNWIGQVWLNMILAAEQRTTQPLQFADRPAIGRISVSSPAVKRAFDPFNSARLYNDQIKPFNFLHTCHVRPFGHPPGVDPKHFHLQAPYRKDPNEWMTLDWFNRHEDSGHLENPYKIATTGTTGFDNVARVKTFADVLREYSMHPESKCADKDGNVCGKRTIGLLQRRHIQVEDITSIGKESNRMEEVQSETIHCAESVYTVYPDERRDRWATAIQPALNEIPISFLTKTTGLARMTVISARQDRRRPHPKNQKLFAAAIAQHAKGGK